MTAFRENIEVVIPALKRYARALTWDADRADDLVQETLVRALQSERLLLGGDVRSWLYSILTNLNKNRRRSLARRPQVAPLLDDNPDASGTEAEGRDIARALSTLAEEQRSVLLLVMLEGLSYREVADIQSVPIGTVMSRLARARAHVKASLEDRMALTQESIASAIGISVDARRGSEENRTELPSQDQARWIRKFDDVLARAEAVFGSRTAAEQWLAQPATGLDQRRPLDLLTTPAGMELVEDLLGRIEHGVYT
jgi:RNA polymerase sigma-70 factor (ECF subfamily)